MALLLDLPLMPLDLFREAPALREEKKKKILIFHSDLATDSTQPRKVACFCFNINLHERI